MTRRALKFSQMPGKFAVCRLPPDAQIPDWARNGPFSSVSRTGDELSIVCAADSVPAEHRPETVWVCFKLQGPFSFSEVGILASFVSPLAEKGVPIFAVSTFDTDYVLVGEDHARTALTALCEAGHEFLP